MTYLTKNNAGLLKRGDFLRVFYDCGGRRIDIHKQFIKVFGVDLEKGKVYGTKPFYRGCKHKKYRVGYSIDDYVGGHALIIPAAKARERRLQGKVVPGWRIIRKNGEITGYQLVCAPYGCN